MEIDHPFYVLKSDFGQGESFNIPKDSVSKSRILSELEGDDPIDLPFSSRTVQRIVEYLAKYNTNVPAKIERPLKSARLKDLVSE